MSHSRIRRREFLKAAGMTTLGLAAAACAPTALPTSAPTAASATAAPAATAAATAVATAVPAPTATIAPMVVGSGNLTVTIWGWWAERMKIFADAAKDFTDKNPNIKVVVQTYGNDLWPKLFASVPAGTGPTLCKMQTTNYFKLRDQNLLLELPKDQFSDDFLKEKYPYHDWAAYGRYCVPEGIQTVLFTYNKELFSAAGLDPNKPPKTWDEFFSTAQKLTVRDSNGTIKQAGVQFDDWLPVLNPLYQLGGKLVKNDGGKLTANFNSPEMAKAFQFFVDANQKYKVWDPQFPYFSDAIGNKQAATAQGESWTYGTWRSDFPDTFKNLAYAAPPTPTGEPAPYYGRKNSVLNLAMMTNRPQDETEAGLKFLAYLIKERIDTQYALADISALLPARAESLTSAKVKNDPYLALSTQLAAKCFDTVDVPNSLNKLVADTMNLVMLENKSIPDALAAGQQGLQALIDNGDVKYIAG